MPLYKYRCQECGKEFTEIIGISAVDTKDTKCPECKSDNVKRLFGAVKFDLRGGGWTSNKPLEEYFK